MAKTITYSSKNVYKNSVLSVLYKGIGMILSLISAPILLSCLGDEKYGVWTSLLGIVSWIYYLDLGIGNGLRIRLSESLAKGDTPTARKYVTVSYALLSGISFLAFFLAVIVIFVIRPGRILNVPAGFDESTEKILVVAIGFVCLNFVLSLVNNILFAVQRASATNALSIMAQALYVVELLIYRQTGSGLILAITILQGVSQLVKNIIGSIWVYLRYPECRIERGKPDFSCKNGILSFGIQSFIINIAALVLNTTDNLLIMQLFGAASVTPYSFCYKFFSMISSVFAVVVVPLQSAYTMAYAKKDVGWIEKNLRRAIALFGLFCAGTVVAGLIFRPFSLVWVKKDLHYESRLILFTALYAVLLMLSHTFSTFTGGIGRMKEATVTGVVQTVMNIPLSIFFAVQLHMGVTGIICGSIAAIALSAVVGMLVTRDELRRMRGVQA